MNIAGKPQYLDMFSATGNISDISFRKYGKQEDGKQLVEFTLNRKKDPPIRFVSFARNVKEMIEAKTIQSGDYIQCTFKIQSHEYNNRLYNDIVSTQVVLVDSKSKNVAESEMSS